VGGVTLSVVVLGSPMGQCVARFLGLGQAEMGSGCHEQCTPCASPGPDACL
jgi:hypothetical protein